MSGTVDPSRVRLVLNQAVLRGAISRKAARRVLVAARKARRKAR